MASEPTSWGPAAAEVLDLLPTVVLVADRGLRCRYVNAAGVRWVGRSERAEVVGRTFDELVPPEVRPANRPYLLAALEGNRQEAQRTFVDGSGSIRHAQAAFEPFRRNGEVIGVLVNITDITARIAAEVAARHDAEERAVQRDRRRLAEQSNDRVTRALFAATLDLSAARPGSAAEHVRITEAIRAIDTAIGDLRTLTLAPVLLEGPGDDPAGSSDLALALTAEMVAVSAGDMIATSDEQGRYTWVSPSAGRVTGWPPDQLLDQRARDFLHPDDTHVAEQLAALADGRNLVTVEHRFRRPDGTFTWVEDAVCALRRPDGSIIGQVTNTRNVEERRRLADDLANALGTFELSFTAAPIGIALVGADGRWLKVNPALAELTGRSESELLATTFQDITHPDDLNADLALAEDVLAGRRSGYEIEKRYLRPDGGEVRVLLSVAGAWSRDGAFRFFISQVQDLSRRPRAK